MIDRRFATRRAGGHGHVCVTAASRLWAAADPDLVEQMISALRIGLEHQFALAGVFGNLVTRQLDTFRQIVDGQLDGTGETADPLDVNLTALLRRRGRLSGIGCEPQAENRPTGPGDMQAIGHVRPPRLQPLETRSWYARPLTP